MLEFHLPQSVDGLITTHRDELRLKVEELGAASHLISPFIDGNLRGEVSPAHLISLTFFPDTPKERRDIHLLGTHVSIRVPYCTSRIVGISEDLRQVKTYSGSVYQISDISSSEPTLGLLLHLCHTLHHWNLGRYFGVLEVFY